MYQSVMNDFNKEKNMKHSDCYAKDLLGGPAGENLAWASPPRSAKSAVDAWYSEVKDCSKLPGCKPSIGGAIGHFTALVWKGAKYMACTRSSENTGLVACRYGGGPGSHLSGNTPNMGGHYKDMVGAKVKTYEECGG